MEDKRMLFIVNPCAGQKKAAKALSDILAVFSREGWFPTVAFTQYSGHAAIIVESLAASGYSLVVCAGGDGTLNEVISGLRKANIDLPIGYLPCGTTNDLASTLELSKNPVQAAEDILSGKQIKLDLGSFNGRSFVYTASFGAFTNVSYGTPQSAKNALGHLAYVLEGARSLTQLKPIRARITADEVVYDGNYLLGSINNTTSLAGIIALDKAKVKLDDGKFEMLLINMPKNILEFNNIIAELSQKRFDNMLSLVSASSFKIETDMPMDWTLDGELEKGSTEFIIKNIAQAITILVP